MRHAGMRLMQSATREATEDQAAGALTIGRAGASSRSRSKVLIAFATRSLHLLRQGTSLKAIGDLLGHRTSEATCVYLRLHVDDLRDAALEVPTERGS